MLGLELNESISLHPEGRHRAVRTRRWRRSALMMMALLAIIGGFAAGDGPWTGSLLEWLGWGPPAANDPNTTPSEDGPDDIAGAIAKTSPVIVPRAKPSDDPAPEALVTTVQPQSKPEESGNPRPGGFVDRETDRPRGQRAEVEHAPTSHSVRHEPTSPEEALRRHGLDRLGTRYLVAGESDVRACRKELWKSYARLYNAAGRRAEIECLDQMILALQENRDWLSFDVADMQNQLCGFRALRNSIDRAEYHSLRNARTLSRADLIDKDRALKFLRSNSPSAAQRHLASYEFDSALEACQTSIRQLRNSVDSLNAEYTRLSEVPDVREALAALGRARHVPQKLGSAELRDIVKELRQVERSLGAG